MEERKRALSKSPAKTAAEPDPKRLALSSGRASAEPPQAAAHLSAAGGGGGGAEDGEPAKADDPVEAFQKDAILREMLVYKSRLSREAAATQQLRTRQNEYEKQISLVHRHWLQFESDLRTILHGLPVVDPSVSSTTTTTTARVEDASQQDNDAVSQTSDEKNDLSPMDLSETAPIGDRVSAFLRVLHSATHASNPTSAEMQSHQTQSILEQTTSLTRNLLQRILARLQQLAQQESLLKSRLQEAAQSSRTGDGDDNADNNKAHALLQQEYERVDAENTRLQTVYDDLLARFHSLTAEVGELTEKLQLSESRTDELESQCEDLKLEIIQAERRLQRERSKFSREYQKQNETAANSTAAQEDAKSAEEKSQENSAAALTPEILQNLREWDELKEKHDTLTDQAENHRKEVEELRNDRARLKEDLDRALLDIHAIPEHRIIETGPYKALKVQADYLRADVENQRQKVDQLNQELEQLRIERRSFMDRVLAEEASRRTALEGEMKKLENDLARIRNIRDQVQAALDVEKSKNKRDDEANTDLRLNANVNKERIRCLLEDLRRMKARMAACGGDEKLLADVLFACEAEMQGVQSEEEIQREVPKMQSLVERLQGRADEAERALALARRDLDSARGGSDATATANFHKRELELQQDLEKTKRKLRRYEATFREAEPSSLQALVEEKQTKLEELELKIKYFEQTEEAAMDEIETISKAFTSLEARQTRQMIIISEKDDQIAKFLTEKAKHDQKLIALQKEKDSHSNKVIALARQAQKAQELIAKLEQSLVEKDSLLATIEKESAQAKAVVFLHERKAQDMTQLAEELTSKIDKSGSKYSEVGNIMKQKETLLETTRSMLRQLDEENRKLQIKIKHLNRRLESNVYAMAAGDPSLSSATVAELRDEIETLKGAKKLMQCNVCNFRTKSHVLLKCMHVFCKECVDTRLETRQRKCPQCGGMFGPNDVKQIYL